MLKVCRINVIDSVSPLLSLNYRKKKNQNAFSLFKIHVWNPQASGTIRFPISSYYGNWLLHGKLKEIRNIYPNCFFKIAENSQTN